MSIEISKLFSTLNYSQMTKLHIKYHSCFHVLIVDRTSNTQYLKIKGKTLRKKIKKSVKKILGFHFIWLVLMYSKLKLDTFSLLELSVDSTCFLVEQPKSAIKLELLSWPPRITASAKNLIPTCPWWSSLNYFLFACSVSFKEHEELGL